MKKTKAMVLFVIFTSLVVGAWAQQKGPLKFAQTIPLPDLHDGDFDHFRVDLAGNRLFATAEENSKVLVFDLMTNKLIHTITDLKAPHSMVYRADLNKLFVVDGDLGEVKIYDTKSFEPAGSVKLREGADASTYDPATKYMYVVNGGDDAHLPNSYISVIDTTSGKVIGEINVDSPDNEIKVFDRTNHNLLATWPLAKEGKKPTAIAFDEGSHRLFVGTRDPGKLIVLDSDSGKVLASMPAWADGRRHGLRQCE